MKKNLFSVSLILAGLIGLASCGSTNENDDGNKKEEFTPVVLKTCGSTSVQKVLEEGIGAKLSELTSGKITVQLNQTGSGDAVTGVTEGKNGTKYDLGFLSREIKADEKTKLTEANKNGAFCKDAVVPIVNSKNPKEATTAAELASLYKGEKTKWNEVIENASGDYATSSIKLYNREAGSGTRECFFEGIGYKDVAKEDKFPDTVQVSSQSSNGNMMGAIKEDEYGIGYCSLDSLTTATGIKGLSYEGVTASEATVLDGTYKLARNFNYVVRADYTEAQKNTQLAVNAFLDFLTSREGLLAIKSKGGIVNVDANAKTWSSIVDEKYPELK